MRDREERGAAAHRREATAGPAVQVELRRAAAAHDFDVAPQHALRVSGAERLHRRFLGGEAAGKMDRRNAAAPAVGDFAVGENAVNEPIAVSLDRLRNAIDVGRIESQPDDVRHDATA